MKKKMRKFEEGGLSKAQEEYLGGADRTDPYIMARMRRAVPDEPKAAPAMSKADAGEVRDETGMISKMRRNTETGELYSTDTSETKTVPKATSSAAPKATPKAEAAPAPKAESKSEAPAAKSGPKVGRAGQAPAGLSEFQAKVQADAESKQGKTQKSQRTSAAEGKSGQSDSSLGDFQARVQKEAEAGQGKGPSLFQRMMNQKSQRTVAAEKSSGMRAGGKVSSASSRGDGCAMRGKTRGRIV